MKTDNWGATPVPGSIEHLQHFNWVAAKRRIPLSGAIDLTHRCNLRCIHCYLGPHAGGEAGRGPELTAEQFCNLLDEAAEAGCLYLLISGGEPLLRQDFPQIYSHARQRGMIVTVFTNATLVTAEHLSVFKEFPPHLVEVSLYGATSGTYEAVTGVPGSFARCLDGIHRLNDCGIRIGLKTMVLRTNVDEVPGIEEIAVHLGVSFRLDPLVCPSLSGGRTPLGERVDPERAVALELADKERLRRLGEFFAKMRHRPAPETLYHCGAGVTAFHIDPGGVLRPCLMATDKGEDAVTSSFARAWEAAGASVSNLRADPNNPCQACEKRAICGYCAGLFALENEPGQTGSAYVCQLGNLRFRYLENFISTGGVSQ
jgi:radical SAM protein with 4Fe4S-binding SPASM domain